MDNVIKDEAQHEPADEPVLICGEWFVPGLAPALVTLRMSYDDGGLVPIATIYWDDVSDKPISGRHCIVSRQLTIGGPAWTTMVLKMAAHLGGQPPKG